jgi:exopolyphosphatase/guanosine-5'-triphosphate,3'-diphosphate pyrophosphatase
MSRIGVIDVGTNSVLLTIAERQADDTIKAIREEAHITRIGEGLGSQPAFMPHAMDRTVKLLSSYRQICEQIQVDRIIAVGTAAFRRAQNAKDFVAAVENELGLTIEIISGEREAELAYHAAAHDFGEDLMVLDIGGGSTEYIWKTGNDIKALSLPLGSVVMHEKYVKTDPINPDEFGFLEAQIMTELTQVYGSSWGGGQAALQKDIPKILVALAGTATTLAAMKLDLETYSHAEVHGTPLSLDEVKGLVERLRAATIQERKKMHGLEPARADVILEGSVILVQTMQLFGYDEVTISDRGVRWGLIYEEFSKAPYP